MTHRSELMDGEMDNEILRAANDALSEKLAEMTKERDALLGAVREAKEIIEMSPSESDRRLDLPSGWNSTVGDWLKRWGSR